MKFGAKAVLAAIVLFSSVAQAKETLATLILLMDMSGSMWDHHRKFASVGEQVKKAVERSNCEIQVGVASLDYADLGDRFVVPWGEPKFISSLSPDAAQKISDRISNPLDYFNSGASEDGQEIFPSVSEEKTYSSVVTAIKKNLPDFEGTQAVGTLILTDAVPAFEDYSIEQANQEISNLLGDLPFLHGTIGIDPNEIMQRIAQKTDCAPDSNIPYDPVARNNKLNQIAAGDLVPQMQQLVDFSKQNNGWWWNICDESYDQALTDYLQMLLEVSGCQLMM